MTLSRILRTAAVAACAFAVLVTSGWAYIRLSGTGSGSGTATVSRTVTIAKGASLATTLVPTGTPSGTLSVSLSNATDATLRVPSLVLDTSQGTGGFSAQGATCRLSYTTQTNGGSGWTVPAGGTLDLTLANAVTMATDAPASCNGADLVVFLKAA